MRIITSISFFAAALLASTAVIASEGPHPAPSQPPIPAPQDIAFPGTIALAVDATDTDRHIIRVTETIPVTGRHMVLAYPKWLPGTHAPEGTINRIAGLVISANGQPLVWTRDPVEVFAFHVQVPAGVRALDVVFNYLAPTSEAVGQAEVSRDIALLQWNALILYPAGYFTRQIPVSARVTLPAGWSLATALDRSTSSGNAATFKTVSVETLVDSPIYSGRYYKQVELDPGGGAPVRLNLFADRPELLEAKPEQIAAHKALVAQAYKLYGSHHYDHYDFLMSLSDNVQFQGLEHHRSSEDGVEPSYFTEWDKGAPERDLLPHEFTHSWNGKFRRPHDLWTPDYTVPMRNSLLWVYEGQTEYWGVILASRSGLHSKQQGLDWWALTAAFYANQAGRAWRPLQDTTNDEIMNPRRPFSWHSYQRFEDYYSEGALIWLEADTLIRKMSDNKRSLDDFARAFFGINNGSYVPVTYTFEDVVATLNQVQAYDWATFLRTRLDGVGRAAPLDGLKRGGYKLVYSDMPNMLAQDADGLNKQTSYTYSLGLVVSKEGDQLRSVVWDSPAFKAGLTEGMKIVAVNGTAYDSDVLTDAVKAAKGSTDPIELIVKAGGHYRTVKLDYHGGLRYPHLERDTNEPSRLDDILAAKK